RRRISRRPRRPLARKHVSARSGAASIHSEDRWKATSIGNPYGPGPSGPDGGDAGAGADFRGGLPSVLVRLPATAERDADARTVAPAWRARRQSRPRRRHSGLLRRARRSRALPAGATPAQARGMSRSTWNRALGSWRQRHGLSVGRATSGP